ncbi:GDP-L-fucose synthase [Burkholderia sp. Bp8998]|uniref:GDP-L-fucose synthase family protein n=1 Tax=Burkholderia sp. Bp8998 TaxID=2184557 RepID=UPI000F595C0A|nr:GDP-L-fucose synthase [Burkholderia sp. Bp8998]RQS08870.1 GDP-L-fucose synthase [Burkholderia sp. Bp8998]
MKIFVAGHMGMAGSAIVRALKNVATVELVTRRRGELDLTRQAAVEDFFRDNTIDLVILAAARVGGILANDTYPADFLYENLMIEANVISAAHSAGVQRLIFLGSSCIYPRACPQPIVEDYLLTGELEKTNDAYAIAKIAGVKLCESYNRQFGRSYVSLMPTNLYGPNDNYDLKTSHVLPALLRKAHEAKIRSSPAFRVWGTGKVRREFLHVDDLARAVNFVIEKNVLSGIYNVGCGEDITIRELADLVSEAVGFEGAIEFDTDKPDGTQQKLLDIRKIRELGWEPKIGLTQGLEMTYQDFLMSGAG